jgi:hypothetical protein
VRVRVKVKRGRNWIRKHGDGERQRQRRHYSALALFWRVYPYSLQYITYFVLLRREELLGSAAQNGSKGLACPCPCPCTALQLSAIDSQGPSGSLLICFCPLLPTFRLLGARWLAVLRTCIIPYIPTTVHTAAHHSSVQGRIVLCCCTVPDSTHLTLLR